MYLFPNVAVMNVSGLANISVMNHHKIDLEISTLKVFINYLSKRYEPLPKIEMMEDPRVKNSEWYCAVKTPSSFITLCPLLYKDVCEVFLLTNEVK